MDSTPPPAPNPQNNQSEQAGGGGHIFRRAFGRDLTNIIDQHRPPARQNQTCPTQRTGGVINVDLHLAAARVINARQIALARGGREGIIGEETRAGIREFLLEQRRVMERLEEDV
ncbi:hypothetical protein [Endozoicomonas sp.]|uniref:hypothetical protein n=1 Tax=Endozoicomonas sp. TaxID=1892382 RepID=UPI002887AB80|nr:hypothetical protein [Endozoicomonas sp.]